MLRWHGQQLGTEFSKKCPAVRNSRTILTELFAPPGSISYSFARRFKSTFWFCILRSFRAWAYHELTMLLCGASICQSGSAKFAWCVGLLAKVSLSRKPYSYIFTLWWSWKIYRSPLCLLFGIREEERSLGKEDEPFTAFPNVMNF